MSEIAEERSSEGSWLENSVKTEKNSSKGSSPDTEEGPTKSTVQHQSTRESTMSEDSDGIKKEVKSESPDVEPKSARGPSAGKGSRRTPPLFSHLPSASEEATKTFQVIQDLIYTAKYLGDSGQDEAMSCDCRSSWSEFHLSCYVLKKNHTANCYRWHGQRGLWRGFRLH